MASPSTDDDASSSSPITLIVRFTTNQPDLDLPVISPSTTSVASVKLLIRTHLPTAISSSRLRLIAAGKVLPDTKSLSATLTIPAPPPPPPPSHKGKEPASRPQASARVYIHCSIGDTLSASDLEAESTLATRSDAALLACTTGPSSSSPDLHHGRRRRETSSQPQASSLSDTDHVRTTTTTPIPRGFDRLLTSGFTSDEIASLRAQFLAVHAARYTPDSMPDPDALRAMEERWLDAGPGSANVATAGSAGDGLIAGAEDDTGLDDMLWGNVMGFFWPLGAIPWLAREQGVWSRRRRIAVLSGFVVNLVFGFFRLSS